MSRAAHPSEFQLLAVALLATGVNIRLPPSCGAVGLARRQLRRSSHSHPIQPAAHLQYPCPCTCVAALVVVMPCSPGTTHNADTDEGTFSPYPTLPRPFAYGIRLCTPHMHLPRYHSMHSHLHGVDPWVTGRHQVPVRQLLRPQEAPPPAQHTLQDPVADGVPVPLRQHL